MYIQCICTLYMYVYTCMPTFIATIANMGQLQAFIFNLKIDCLRLFVVVYTLVVFMLCYLYFMCIPAFIVSSADVSHLWVYLSYLLIYCLRLFTNL